MTEVMELVSPKQACAMTSLSRTTIWRMTEEGLFPKPIQLTSRRYAYKRSDIAKWVLDRQNNGPVHVAFMPTPRKR